MLLVISGDQATIISCHVRSRPVRRRLGWGSLMLSGKDNVFFSVTGEALSSLGLLGSSAPFDGGHIPGVCGGTESLLYSDPSLRSSRPSGIGAANSKAVLLSLGSWVG